MIVAKKPGAVFEANGDAFDIGNYEEIVITEENPIIKVKTGLKVALDTPAYILPRSGISSKVGRAFMIANTPGYIDVDYRGEIMILFDIDSRLLYRRIYMLDNFPIKYCNGSFVIAEKSRLAQLDTKFDRLSINHEFNKFEYMYPTERGINGFGSTGY